jgi:protein tyrosine/serine phosphatase
LLLALCNTLFLLLAVQAVAKDKSHKSKEKSSDELEVKNFGKVNDHVFRGGQPEDSEYEQLAARGIKTVIDLRDDAKDKARRLAEAAGMRYVNLRLDDKVPPTPEESKLFLHFVNDQTNWPVYVHCAGGRHRTGVLVAIYRMEVDGWDARRAYGEMKDFKFYSSWGHGEMKDFVFDYFRRMTEARIQSAMAPTSRPRRVSEYNQKGK